MMAKTRDMRVTTVPAPPPAAAGARRAEARGPGAAAPARTGADEAAAGADAEAAGAAAADLGAAGPPGFGAESFTVGEAVCFGGKLIRTVCFFCDCPAALGFSSDIKISL